VRFTTALTAALLLLAAAAAEAPASNLVFVCGKNLCAASGEGRGRLALTHDGGARGAYSRPSLARSGKRIAFTLGGPRARVDRQARAQARAHPGDRPTHSHRSLP
jgi:hypothetical protein